MRLAIALGLVALILPACSRGDPPPAPALPAPPTPTEVTSPLSQDTEFISAIEAISDGQPVQIKEREAQPKPPTTQRHAAPKVAAKQTASLEPGTVEAGEQEVVVQGRNWGPRSIVNVRLVEPGPGRGEFLTFTVPATSNGQFKGRFIVPSEVAPGDYLVEVTSRSGGYVALALEVTPSTNASPDEGAGRQTAL